MPARRHLYFAYGSNLCARQMAQRCPDAADPRPAVLADHDWLINQRGVATVEPLAGNQVHGVVWRISDGDLATLDSAEGCRCATGVTGSPCTPMTGRRRPGCTSTTG